MFSPITVLVSIARLGGAGRKPSIGDIARIYEISYYRAGKTVRCLEEDGLVTRIAKRWRPNAVRYCLQTTPLGEMVAMVVDQYDDHPKEEELPW